MNAILKKTTLGFFIALAAVYILLAIIGGFRTYTPVPFWDMWDGYMDFYLRLYEGDLSVWWSQHNEHRIFLSRLLFWIDIHFFKSSCTFLIITNYISCGLICYLFYIILRKAFINKDDLFLRRTIFLFILAFTFSWIQNENLIQPFQNQFYFTYLIPLIALYSLYLFSIDKEIKFFIFSCLAGIASAGAMSNGVLAFPSMIILAIFLKLRWKTITCLVVLFGVTAYLFFHNYNVVFSHESIINTLLHRPISLINFFLLYLGGPFYFISGKNNIIGILAGLFLITSYAIFTYINIRKPHRSPLQLVLIIFLLYIFGSAFAAAGLRLDLTPATTSRYMTPTLMAWSIIIIMFVMNMQKRNAYKIMPALTLILSLLLPFQFRATHSDPNNIFERELGALAAKMQIKDKQQIERNYPNMDRALNITKNTIKNDLLLFGTQRINDVYKLIGQIDSPHPTANCIGCIEKISSIEGEPAYMKIKGWLYDSNTKKVPTKIHILDLNNKIIGFAITGRVRRDLAKTISPKARYAGFEGYMLSEQVENNIKLHGVNFDHDGK